MPCPSNPSQICAYFPKFDGSGYELIPFPIGGSAGNQIYDNLMYSVRFVYLFTKYNNLIYGQKHLNDKIN